MPAASQRFLDSIGVGVHRVRPWDCPDAPILFFSEHDSVWDGFLLSIVSDAGRDVRRVVFTPTAMMFGREFCRRNITVYPQIVWRKLFFGCRSFRERVQYFCTHRPGPFAWVGPFKSRRGENVAAICDALAASADVCLLPAGAIGYPRWCTGIGAVILDYQQRLGSHASPLMLAPVYINWNSASDPKREPASRRFQSEVEVVAPVLVPAASLLEAARREIENPDRRTLTEWLRSRYQEARWDMEDVPRAMAPQPSLHRPVSVEVPAMASKLVASRRLEACRLEES